MQALARPASISLIRADARASISRAERARGDHRTRIRPGIADARVRDLGVPGLVPRADPVAAPARVEGHGRGLMPSALVSAVASRPASTVCRAGSRG